MHVTTIAVPMSGCARSRAHERKSQLRRGTTTERDLASSSTATREKVGTEQDDG